ncbi:MAG: WD40 repeat domain-containing serine/threonine protein kinase [Verrucomicrobiota bacterium]
MAETPQADFFMAALWDATQPVEIGVPGYTILSEISRGGMGVVYHARQARPEREVALKVLLPHLAEEPEMLARFQLEARAMAALDHPGILPVYEVGEADGVPFFSMKLATGGSLAERLRNGPLPPREAAVLLVQLLRPLHHAHQHGVLHRDLKPGNFLFLDDGRACVSDFGLAKLAVQDQRPLTRTESFFGTPHYMPPEVAAGSAGDSTVAGDLYSMGAVLYECLTGRRPHEAKENVAALLRSIADDAAIPLGQVDPALPRNLCIVCMKALERSPKDRYATAEDFADDVQRWLDGKPVRARPAGLAETAWRWACRHPLPAGLIAVLVGVMVGGTALLAASYQQRGAALSDARQKLHRSLIEQARSERLLGVPGFRDRAMSLLQQAAALARSPEIRDEAAALLARPDISPSALPRTATAIPPTEEKWQAAQGREILRILTPDGKSAVVAGTTLGVILENLETPGEPRVLAPDGPVVRFLSMSPDGQSVALARVDGVTWIDLAEPAQSWHFGAAQARCAAAFSRDGSRMAVATGDRREAVVLATATGEPCATMAVTGTPQDLAFHPNGTLLAVATDDGKISLGDAASGVNWLTLAHQAASLRFSDDGKELLASGDNASLRAWPVTLPVAFQAWPEPPRTKTDGAVVGMSLSPNGKQLLTLTANCIAIWSTAESRQTDHHLLENQRIDAKASAWWLNDREILLQVPGGLERLAVDENGKIAAPTRLPRVPGSTVLDVLSNGDWIVSVMDEDGNDSRELWPTGNFEEARPLKKAAALKSPVVSAAADGRSATLIHEDEIEVRNSDGKRLRLVPPLNPGVRGLAFSADGERLLILTRNHRVFSWNLGELAAALDAQGL